MQLVLMAQAPELHGLLVERREANRVDVAGERRVHALVQYLQHRPAARRSGPAALHVGGCDALDREESWPRRVGPVPDVGKRSHIVHCHLGAGGALSIGPQPAIADQHNIGHGRRCRLGQQLGDQFGADAGGIAERERDHGFC